MHSAIDPPLSSELLQSTNDRAGNFLLEKTQHGMNFLKAIEMQLKSTGCPPEVLGMEKLLKFGK